MDVINAPSLSAVSLKALLNNATGSAYDDDRPSFPRRDVCKGVLVGCTGRSYICQRYDMKGQHQTDVLSCRTP